MDFTKFGRKRCRLSEEQRDKVYKVFEVYVGYTKESGMWDDCDRISALVRRLQHAKTSCPDVYEHVCRSKVYVDEIQDYTQAEILLFFYLTGPGDLFFAGDPAQSVVECTDFRFEEIRSVGYHVAGPSRIDLIPSKPKTVNVNFRSHSGILNTAAAVLGCLFSAFHDSAKQLKEDRGLFKGPRPGVLHRVSHNQLKQAVADNLNGAVVLTRDASVSRLRRALGGYPLVYGIREAKGLEFQSVILLDFFRDLQKSLQKPWRDLLLGRASSDFREHCPEIEGHLKLLYTAITRCIEQLFVLESGASNSGDAFVRWLTITTFSNVNRTDCEAFAERCSLDTTLGLTPDQWRAAGLDNAIMAESVREANEAEYWLEKALYCFQQVSKRDGLGGESTVSSYQCPFSSRTGQGNQR